MNGRAPWYAGLLVALLTYAKTKYPEHAALIDSLILGLGTTWGLNVLGHLKNGTAARSS